MERHPGEVEEHSAQHLADLSHDLRTPLNAILGLTELMRLEAYGPMGDGRYRSFVQDIHEAGTELMRHIDDLLSHSQMSSGPLEEENPSLG